MMTKVLLFLTFLSVVVIASEQGPCIGQPSAEEFCSFQSALMSQESCESYCKKWSNHSYPYNVDTCIDANNRHWADHINDGLRNLIQRRQALSLAELVQAERSNKKITLEVLLKLWKHDPTVFGDLLHWYKKYPVDFDTKISVFTTFWDSITFLFGEVRYIKDMPEPKIEEWRAQRKNWLKIAYLVQNDRSNKTVVFKILLDHYIEDQSLWGDVYTWFNTFPLDVDADQNHTMREKISHLFYRSKNQGLQLAELVQAHRSDKAHIFITLFNVWRRHTMCRTNSLLDDIQAWFKRHPIDIDTLQKKESTNKTHSEQGNAIIEDDIDAEIKKLLVRNWNKGYVLAHLVQGKRSDSLSIFRFLFEKYLSNITLLNRLKSWIIDYPVKTDTIIFNGVQTYAEKINSLNSLELINIFRHQSMKAD